MKPEVKSNWTLILSIVAIVCSIVTIILFFLKVTPNSVVDISTFIGTMTALIGISVTLVVGFQIYSVITMKDKLTKIDSLHQELIETKESLDILDTELKGKLLEMEAYSEMDKGNYADAYKKLSYALVHYSSLDSKKEDLKSHVRLLQICSYGISDSDFEGSGEIKDILIDAFILSIQDDYLKIKATKYFWSIKKQYMEIYTETLAKVKSYKDKV